MTLLLTTCSQPLISFSSSTQIEEIYLLGDLNRCPVSSLPTHFTLKTNRGRHNSEKILSLIFTNLSTYATLLRWSHLLVLATITLFYGFYKNTSQRRNAKKYIFASVTMVQPAFGRCLANYNWSNSYCTRHHMSKSWNFLRMFYLPTQTVFPLWSSQDTRSK